MWWTLLNSHATAAGAQLEMLTMTLCIAVQQNALLPTSPVIADNGPPNTCPTTFHGEALAASWRPTCIMKFFMLLWKMVSL